MEKTHHDYIIDEQYGVAFFSSFFSVYFFGKTAVFIFFPVVFMPLWNFALTTSSLPDFQRFFPWKRNTHLLEENEYSMAAQGGIAISLSVTSGGVTGNWAYQAQQLRSKKPEFLPWKLAIFCILPGSDPRSRGRPSRLKNQVWKPSRPSFFFIQEVGKLFIIQQIGTIMSIVSDLKGMYIYIHIYLEPFCPLLWGLNPPGSRYIFCK